MPDFPLKHGPAIHAQLTPATRMLVEAMAKAPYPPMHTLTGQQAREGYAKAAGVLDVLKSYGCDEVQGFHCGRPMPADSFMEFIAGRA